MNINNAFSKPYNITKISFKEKQGTDLLDPFNDNSQHRLKSKDFITPTALLTIASWGEDWLVETVSTSKFLKFFGALSVSLIPTVLVDRGIRQVLFNKEDAENYSIGHKAYNTLRSGTIFAGIYKLMEATDIVEKYGNKINPYPLAFLAGVATSLINQCFDPFGLKGSN